MPAPSKAGTEGRRTGPATPPPPPLFSSTWHRPCVTGKTMEAVHHGAVVGRKKKREVAERRKRTKGKKKKIGPRRRLALAIRRCAKAEALLRANRGRAEEGTGENGERRRESNYGGSRCRLWTVLR